MVGASSADIRLRGVVDLVGDVRELTVADVAPTRTAIGEVLG